MEHGLTPDPSSRSPTEPEAGFHVKPAETSVTEGKVVGVGRDGLGLVNPGPARITPSSVDVYSIDMSDANRQPQKCIKDLRLPNGAALEVCGAGDTWGADTTHWMYIKTTRHRAIFL